MISLVGHEVGCHVVHGVRCHVQHGVGFHHVQHRVWGGISWGHGVGCHVQHGWNVMSNMGGMSCPTWGGTWGGMSFAG